MHPFSRRKFLRNSLWGSLTLPFGLTACQNASSQENINRPNSQKKASPDLPIVISTWAMGRRANEAAWEALQEGKSALDAVETGVKVIEADPKVSTVGYGATPDKDGRVTLDACIMDHQGNAGSVCCIQHIMHPVSVARKIMEETPHVILVGEGAFNFALAKGFPKENLLTENSRKHWEKWKIEEKYEPIINIENHDTIGMLALDKNGDLSGACTTSGLGFKLPGRVGDSPIIGAGLFVDNEVGAATATGLGELVLKTLGTFLVVELMRQGYPPQEACKEAIQRIVKKYPKHEKAQVGYIALNKDGEYGAYSIHKNFGFSLRTNQMDETIKSPYVI